MISFLSSLEDLKTLLESKGFSGEFLGDWTQVDFSRVGRPKSLGNQTDLGFCYLTGTVATGLLNSVSFLLVDRDWQGRSDRDLKDFPRIRLPSADAAMDVLAHEYARRKKSIPLDAPRVDSSAHIETGVVMGLGSVIEAGCVVESGARLGSGVRVGPGTFIGAHTYVGDDVVIGSNCWIGPCTVVGSPGFGFVKYPGDGAFRARKHVGSVVLGNQVRLGSFVAVDAGVFEPTQIADAARIDNHVQVAHNCEIGASSILCAMVGLSGGTVLEERVTLAGMVGTTGHLRIGAGVTVGGQSGVTKDIPPGNAAWKGYPPVPMKEFLRQQVLLGKIDELWSRVKELEKKVNP